ncbi:MAG: hypothetical protein JWO97_288 [Acidobacteria bacterium]|nr:hypothetical protein [Acidobacteriota bacterium]
MFKGRRVLCLQLLCATVILVGSCKSGNNDGGNEGLTGDTANSKLVQVTVDGSTITCKPDPVKPRRNMHKVIWTSANELSIMLPKNFPQPDCKKAGSIWKCTSKVFTRVERIKYDVQVNGPSGPKLDPMIDVQPDDHP